MFRVELTRKAAVETVHAATLLGPIGHPGRQHNCFSDLGLIMNGRYFISKVRCFYAVPLMRQSAGAVFQRSFSKGGGGVHP
jgi:hypothetical protein